MREFDQIPVLAVRERDEIREYFITQGGEGREWGVDCYDKLTAIKSIIAACVDGGTEILCSSEILT